MLGVDHASQASHVLFMPRTSASHALHVWLTGSHIDKHSRSGLDVICGLSLLLVLILALGGSSKGTLCGQDFCKAPVLLQSYIV